MELISLGIPFSNKMINVIDKAQGFSDRLAIYANETKDKFKIICKKCPTDKQLLAIRMRLSSWNKKIDICLMLPDKTNIEVNGITLQEWANN